MSDAMSTPNDWVQFYQHSLSGQVVSSAHATTTTAFGDGVSDATVVTATASMPSSSTSNLSPEGRVSKPVRRRSRASRRTPTTLLNTDTTNFRAMVQQFTGGPSAPFASGSHPGAPNFSFGLGARQGHVNPNHVVMVPPGYHLHQYQQQIQQQQQQQPQQQQYQQQNQHYMFSHNSNTSTGDVFLQRLGNPRPNMEVSEGFVMEGVSAQVPSSPRPPSSNENRRTSYMF